MIEAQETLRYFSHKRDGESGNSSLDIHRYFV